VTSATCSLPAPSAAGNYNAVFFSNKTYTVFGERTVSGDRVIAILAVDNLGTVAEHLLQC
jgi:hypothetical protein